MLATINNSLLNRLKPKGKPYDVRDDKLTGFLVRVNITGKLVFMCEYARGKRVTLGKAGSVLTSAQARDMARQVLADATRGITPNAKQKNNSAMNLKQFIESNYLPWVEAHRKDAKRTVARIRRCFYKPFGDKPLSEITPILVEQWRTQRLKYGLSAQTVNRDIATFKAALSKAVEWDFLDRHPLAKLRLIKVDNSIKIRYLTDEEENRLRKTLDERENNLRLARERANKWRQERDYPLLSNLNTYHFVDCIKPMVLLSINTGIRQGELFLIAIKDIDFIQKTLTIAGEKAKSGRTRHIPLNEEAFDILLNWYDQTSPQDLIFPSKEGKKFNNVRKSWLSILAAAQIKNFRWHDLRHHFASKLVMAGVDLNTVRELLGHSDIKMTLRYAHLAPEHKAAAVAKLIIKRFI